MYSFGYCFKQKKCFHQPAQPPPPHLPNVPLGLTLPLTDTDSSSRKIAPKATPLVAKVTPIKTTTIATSEDTPKASAMNEEGAMCIPLLFYFKKTLFHIQLKRHKVFHALFAHLLR